MTNKKELGAQGENLAAKYLTCHGYELIEKNYRCPFGEIDIIARRADIIVFIEVKTRQSMKFGRPGEAVNYYKQQKIIKTAQWYIHSSQLDRLHFRFDVLEILRTPAGQATVNHVRNAFELS